MPRVIKSAKKRNVIRNRFITNLSLKKARTTDVKIVRRGRWFRRVRLVLAIVIVIALIIAYGIRDHVRTLSSLRRIEGTNAYVMDYYLDYNLEEIEAHGMDVENIEDSCLQTFFPDVIVPIARSVKRSFIPEKIETTEAEGENCSTLFLQDADGNCYFARNQDYYNDAFLILRIHDRDGLASIALIDLEYLNLNRDDLDETSLIERIPLLFAPYYAFDGINRHGVAVGIMSVEDQPVEVGHDRSKPNVINSTLMRILLDNAKSTEEAVEIARRYNVHFVEEPQHVLIGDRSGDSGILEHVDGELRFVRSETDWQLSTNHQMYNVSEESSDEHCRRYRKGSAIAEAMGDDFRSEDVERAIRSMSVENWTMWTCIYNLSSGQVKVGYKTQSDNWYVDRINVPHE